MKNEKDQHKMNSQSLSRILTQNVLNAKLQRKFNIYNKTPPTLVLWKLILWTMSIVENPSPSAFARHHSQGAFVRFLCQLPSFCIHYNGPFEDMGLPTQIPLNSSWNYHNVLGHIICHIFPIQEHINSSNVKSKIRYKPQIT